MEEKTFRNFVRRSEGMVQPETAGFLTLAAGFFKHLPVTRQKRMVRKAQAANPFMGFIVDPYSLFLCYEIQDPDRARHLLPNRYRLIPTKITESGEKKHYLITGIFSLHTSAFWGTRVEHYLIAEDRNTGLLTWIILDYGTNTSSFDPGRGFSSGSAKPCLFTTTCGGEILADVAVRKRRLTLSVDLKNRNPKKLNRRLWLEGNLSVDYGAELHHEDSAPFGLIFNPDEVAEAWELPKKNCKIEEMTWFPDLIGPEPETVICFPYAQHFISPNGEQGLDLRTEEDLERAVENQCTAPASSGFSTRAIKRSLLIGSLISMTISTTAILWLILHYVIGH